jgi:hypothetical protein
MTVLFLMLLIILATTAAGIIIALRRHAARPKHLSAEDKGLVHLRWHEIEQHLAAGGPSRFKSAVIEGDKLVDYCMKELGIEGGTMGERLRNAGPARFSNYEGLWAAHKVRNQLVHEIDRELHSSEAKQSTERFKTALQDLGAL